jgi:hypothetical protein
MWQNQDTCTASGALMGGATGWLWYEGSMALCRYQLGLSWPEVDLLHWVSFERIMEDRTAFLARGL